MTDQPKTEAPPAEWQVTVTDSESVQQVIVNELAAHRLALANLDFMQSELQSESTAVKTVPQMGAYRQNALRNAVIVAVDRVNRHAAVLRCYGIGIPDVSLEEPKKENPEGEMRKAEAATPAV